MLNWGEVLAPLPIGRPNSRLEIHASMTSAFVKHLCGVVGTEELSAPDYGQWVSEREILAFLKEGAMDYIQALPVVSFTPS